MPIHTTKLTVILPGNTTPANNVSVALPNPDGYIAGIHFTVPDLSGSTKEASVAIHDAVNTAIIHVPSSAVGSGACVKETTTSGYFSVNGPGYAVFGADAVVKIVLTDSQSAARTFEIWVLIEKG